MRTAQMTRGGGRHGCPSMQIFLKVIVPTCGLMTLAACAPSAPQSAAGVGFGDYGSYLAQQQARNAPPGLVPPRQVVNLPPQPYSGTFPTSGPTGGPAGSEAQSVASAAVAAVRPGAAGPQAAGDPLPLPQAATGQAGAGLTRDDVLDMDTARATRASEQAAFEQRRTTFQQVAPTALPDRPADVPNITAFALATTHGVGMRRYTRSRMTVQNTARNCAGFASDDLAQEEFLRRGGPERDPLNLDPDGDGFACGWSPEPFRAAARAAR